MATKNNIQKESKGFIDKKGKQRSIDSDNYTVFPLLEREFP